MIILGSSSANVRKRWAAGLSEFSMLDEAESFESLEHMLPVEMAALVLLDLALPGLDGVSDVAAMAQRHPQARFIAFADRPDPHEGTLLLKYGVAGYGNTYMAPALLAKAVQVVQAGEVWVGRKLITQLIEDLAQANRHHSVVPDHPSLASLTEREREVASLVGGGANNKRIAQALDITERTVKAHISSIFRKTGTNDRLQLALIVNSQPVASRRRDVVA